MGIITVISVVRLLGDFINQYVLALGANLDSLPQLCHFHISASPVDYVLK